MLNYAGKLTGGNAAWADDVVASQALRLPPELHRRALEATYLDQAAVQAARVPVGTVTSRVFCVLRMLCSIVPPDLASAA